MTRLITLLLPLLLVVLTSRPVAAANTVVIAEPVIAQASSTTALPTVAPADLRFGPGHSTAVISSAQKFILPVGSLGAQGELLVYPADHPRAGTPILDYEGNPIGDRGLVFFNYADQSVQAVAGDGEGVVIINEVTADQAIALYQQVADLAADPNQLSLEQLKQVLAFAYTELGLGDCYNSTRSFIQAQMSPVLVERTATQGDAIYGFKKRDSRDISQAVYIPGAFRFAGPAATSQVFENGGVIIQQQDDQRGVQPDIFLRTYTFSDGRPITAVTDLATQTPF